MKYLSFLLKIDSERYYTGFSSADKLTDEKGAECTFSTTKDNLGQTTFKWTGGNENDGTLQVVWRYNGSEETRECPSGHIAAYYTITITDSDITWELEKVE
ncbi:MAG: hypothetical protein J6I73_07455 [Treponema sp.]|nr:hypothetical protein [Treponema sp.]